MPTFMSKVNANRVPWVAVLVQSIISAVLTAVTFIIAPYSLSTGFRPDNLFHNCLCYPAGSGHCDLVRLNGDSLH